MDSIPAAVTTAIPGAGDDVSQDYCSSHAKPVRRRSVEAWIALGMSAASLSENARPRQVSVASASSKFQFGHVKVDQQARFDVGQFHVSQELRLVNPLGLFDRLQFDNQFIFDQHVDPVSVFQSDSLVFNRLWILQLE